MKQKDKFIPTGFTSLATVLLLHYNKFQVNLVNKGFPCSVCTSLLFSTSLYDYYPCRTHVVRSSSSSQQSVLCSLFYPSNTNRLTDANKPTRAATHLHATCYMLHATFYFLLYIVPELGNRILSIYCSFFQLDNIEIHVDFPRWDGFFLLAIFIKILIHLFLSLSYDQLDLLYINIYCNMLLSYIAMIAICALRISQQKYIAYIKYIAIYCQLPIQNND